MLKRQVETASEEERRLARVLEYAAGQLELCQCNKQGLEHSRGQLRLDIARFNARQQEYEEAARAMVREREKAEAQIKTIDESLARLG